MKLGAETDLNSVLGINMKNQLNASRLVFSWFDFFRKRSKNQPQISKHPSKYPCQSRVPSGPSIFLIFVGFWFGFDKPSGSYMASKKVPRGYKKVFIFKAFKKLDQESG